MQNGGKPAGTNNQHPLGPTSAMQCPAADSPNCMGWESVSRIGKRMREENDEVYLDNFHSNKRYLTEVISCSLNGLRVGDSDDSLRDTIAVSPPRSETAMATSKSISFRSLGEDQPSPMDSPMSDDSEDSVWYRMIRTSESPHQRTTFNPASPASPDRSLSRSPYAHRQQRSHDIESRLPPSPSDSCQPGDLRRAALMRALQMRALSPGAAGLQVLDQEKSPLSKSDREDHGDDKVLRSPTHGTFQASARASTSARSLLLDDKSDASAGGKASILQEEMDNGASNVQKRSRATAADCSSSRLKRSKVRRFSQRVFTGGDVSDTESSF